MLDTLRATKLPEWGTPRDAIPTRFKQALAEAATVLEPKAQHVKLPGGTTAARNTHRGDFPAGGRPAVALGVRGRRPASHAGRATVQLVLLAGGWKLVTREMHGVG